MNALSILETIFNDSISGVVGTNHDFKFVCMKDREAALGIFDALAV
jgi:uncharacterized ferritin-like protein (DUF455 family)